MTDSIPLVKLNSGYSIPQLGLGTWLSKNGTVGQSVRNALELGYRHIDCAMAYGNQDEIGPVFEDIFSSGKVNREEVFITSKIWNTFHSYGKASEAVDLILRDLRLSYLDLCLIHWPQGYYEADGLFPKDDSGKIINADTDYLETWRAMEDAHRAGKIRSLGVSNFNPQQVDRILANSTVKMSNLQVEAHPYFAQTGCVDFCKQRGLVLTCYSPLANPGHMFRQEGQPDLLAEPLMLDIAERHSKTPAQVAIRWAIQRGTVTIPKSINRDRLKENLNVMDFKLTDADVTAINGLDRNLHILSLERDLDHPLFPFKIPY